MLAQTDLFPAMQMSAVLSGPGNCYRDELCRVWDDDVPMLPVCMCNPSTADHERNDPTLLTLIHFAKLWGYGGLLVVNVFSFRSPSPAVMLAAADPVGPDNARHVAKALIYARDEGNRCMLAAWGNHGASLNRHLWVCNLAEYYGVDLVCLGTTDAGHPKHPLARGKQFIPRDTWATTWRSAGKGEDQGRG